MTGARGAGGKRDASEADSEPRTPVRSRRTVRWLRRAGDLVALVGVVLGVLWLYDSDPEPATAAPKSCVGSHSPCIESLAVFVKDGVRCAVYQAGGPNSARMWCAGMEPAVEGQP